MGETVNQAFGDFETAILGEVADTATLQLPDPELLTHYKHLLSRRLWVDFEVDAQIMDIIRDVILWNIEDAGTAAEERKPIWLYMFNYGGSADLMWALIDIIHKSETPIYTVNLGQCGSAAALIFMAGHKRLMMPSATVVIHEGSNQLGGDAVKVIDQAESYKAMVKRMREYILAHTKIPPATMSRKKNNDWELTAGDCIKLGVCDKIVETISEIF